jgi:hypothetical protein
VRRHQQIQPGLALGFSSHLRHRLLLCISARFDTDETRQLIKTPPTPGNSETGQTKFQNFT